MARWEWRQAPALCGSMVTMSGVAAGMNGCRAAGCGLHGPEPDGYVPNGGAKAGAGASMKAAGGNRSFTEKHGDTPIDRAHR